MADKLDRGTATKEMGVAGEATRTGLYNSGEFLPQLRGAKALKVYREMRDNDATVGAILTAMDMLLRRVEWRVEAADDSDAALAERDFVESLLGDMSHTFEEFLSEVLSFLPFGFSFFEIVMKQRRGLNGKVTSRFNDSRLGIRKLAPRAQWTLERWAIDDSGGLQGFTQRTPSGDVTIPISKGLLFRTVNSNNDPSGRSVLRNAYKAWFYKSHIQGIEAIAIERELNGLPIGRLPSEYLSANATPTQRKIRDGLKDILRDVKKNEQGYILLPSDVYEDPDGKPTSTRMVEVELISSNGSREIDTGKTILRYQQDMARTVLADFVLLGQSERGSFALSKNKSDLFLRSMEGYLSAIAAVLNRHLLPRIWAINGLNPDLMPEIVPGDVAPTDLDELGNYIQKLAASGAPLFPDQELENELRAKAGLPDAPDDPDIMGAPE